MPIFFNFINPNPLTLMLYIPGIAIDFFLVLILAGKKNRSEADNILAAWLFFIGLHLTFYYLYVTHTVFEMPYLIGMGIPFPLVHGPFLFLYTSSLTNQVWNRKWRLLHFMPFVITYIALLPFLFSSTEHKAYVYEHRGIGYEWLMVPLHILIIASGIAYVSLSLLKLRRHRKNIENQFSNTERINLNWLRYLIYGMAVIWMVVLTSIDEYIYGTVVMYVIFMGYFGVKQTTIFTHQVPLLLPEPDVLPTTEKVIEESVPAEAQTDNRTKYVKSGLKESDQYEIHEKLNSLMAEKKLFANPELTLGETAQYLAIHPNYLSQVINSVAKRNFYDYINALRVEEFNRAVQKPENRNFTLLSLAYECGFNSKTSFNRNFRKITGLSPSEYLKQQQVVPEN